jgi:citrate lyase subunit beta/citryl-CoA lyase
VTPLTWLYVPGDRPERFDKALASGADVVILDLEDAVAPAGKEQARREVAAFLASYDGEVPVHVRVEGLDSLRAVTGAPGLAALRLPKVESAAAVEEVAALCPEPLLALLESARGLAAAADVAAHPRVAGLALGEQDLRAELGITHPAALDQLRVSVVLAAAAAGLPAPPASVYPHHRDDAGLLADTRHARTLGMLGRTAIHPRQLPVIREAFAPDDAELAWARDVVAAGSSGGATTSATGDFVDAPVLARAHALLALADRLA